RPIHRGHLRSIVHRKDLACSRTPNSIRRVFKEDRIGTARLVGFMLVSGRLQHLGADALHDRIHAIHLRSSFATPPYVVPPARIALQQQARAQQQGSSMSWQLLTSARYLLSPSYSLLTRALPPN